MSAWIMTEQPPLGRTSGERLFIRNHEEVREVRSWRFYAVWRGRRQFSTIPCGMI
ncbi:hypothetical protein [Paenibacillus jamilae]|uniref:hypothetical protein n=1 Tax=Paenibacillus jamilae TaxID=114136 RepID=UPI003D2963C4